MCDFMRRLGLEYPIDENGELATQPEGAVTVATARGLEEKAQMKKASARAPPVFDNHTKAASFAPAMRSILNNSWFAIPVPALSA